MTPSQEPQDGGAAIKWKDATSYSQGQYGRIDPTAWECVIEGIRIWVSCGHRYYPGEWVVTCLNLGIDCKQIGKIENLSADQARALASGFVSAAARSQAETLEKMARRLAEGSQP